jgi:hypothetical protein
MIFIVSIVPFRSEWKYKDRAVRYCYLDAGHQAGAIIASSSTQGQNATILSDIDALSLNEKMGFNAQEFTCMAIGVGEETTKNVEPLSLPLMQVPPTDYWESNGIFIKQLNHYKYTVSYPVIHSFCNNIASIYDRRSVRLFEDQMIPSETAEYFMTRIDQVPHPLSADIVIFDNGAKEPGLYKQGEIYKKGMYAETLSHLLVDQKFIKNAAMVIVFTAERFTADALITAGVFSHMLSLEAEERHVGFTGIGAFYDKKLQNFLETDHPILYVCALGKARS